MKKLFTLTMITLLTTATAATDIDFGGIDESNTFRRVIKEATHKSTITLDKSTVRCSALGYGLEELKIGIPTLAWRAIFDHSNQDGRGPCVTAGTSFCKQQFNLPSKVGIPEVLLNPDKPTEEVDVKVVLTEEFRIDFNNKCVRTLLENVITDVRGITFTHLRTKNIGELPLQECLDVIQK
ncbi:MAG: hypothetical protein BM556_01755 [Bacteriovorax sp. MedPE-SWde]|nr:MAG: hypothetical protein BM556_01755 [Bacteriovorax sp. MedPE-SWde]